MSHNVRKTFALCWAAYFGSYLARLNYAAVMSELIGPLLTLEQAGWISTAFLVAYAGGQLINGMLAERMSAMVLICFGLIGSAVGTVLFPLAGNFEGMLLLLRFATGYCMSTLWPAILQLFAATMDREDAERCSVHLSSSGAIGTLCAYALSAWMLDTVGWQGVFWVPAALLGTVAVLWLALFPGLRRAAGSRAVQSVQDARAPGSTQTRPDMQSTQALPDTQPPPDAQPAAPPPQISLLAMLRLPGVLIVFVPAILHGVIKDGVTAWIPTYITDIFTISAARTALILAVLPVVNLSGAYAARWIMRHGPGDELRGSAVFFALSIAALALMLAFGGRSVVLTLALFAIITSAMLAVNVLLVGLLPLRYYQYGRTATLSGALNAAAYGGSALASGVIGMLSARWGWNSAVLSWLLCMVLAMLVCVLFAPRRRR